MITASVMKLKMLVFKSSRPQKGVLENFEKFTGKHVLRDLFLNKVAGLGTLSKRDFDTGVFL